MKPEVTIAEIEAYNRGVLHEYGQHVKLTMAERKALHQWLRRGHSAHRCNPWGYRTDDGFTELDFIPAFRRHKVLEAAKR